MGCRKYWGYHWDGHNMGTEELWINGVSFLSGCVSNPMVYIGTADQNISQENSNSLDSLIIVHEYSI